MIFLLAGWLMRHFNSIIGVDSVDVLDRRHDRTMGGVIASEFVGHQPPWLAPLGFEQTMEEGMVNLTKIERGTDNSPDNNSLIYQGSGSRLSAWIDPNSA